MRSYWTRVGLNPMRLMIYKEERYRAEAEIGVKRTHKPGSKHLGPSELEQQGGTLAWRLWRQHGPADTVISGSWPPAL